MRSNSLQFNNSQEEGDNAKKADNINNNIIPSLKIKENLMSTIQKDDFK